MTRAVIIEDELDAQNLLSNILEKYCSNMQVVGIASDIHEGIQMINSIKPDLVFLDIQLGEQTGFQLLDQLDNPSFQLVITTAYQDFAVKAFEYEAIDYVLKPYTPKTITSAVERVMKRTSTHSIYQKLETLFQEKKGVSKINLPTTDGIILINSEDIVRVEADRSYSCIYLINGQKEIVSKPLKEIQEQLSSHLFYRLHSSHLINLQQLEKYSNEDGGYAFMSDQSQIPIARRRKNEFLDRIKSKGNNNRKAI